MSADLGLELQALATWTPFLLEGFLWNIAIAALAMVLGTVAGAGLAWLRMSRHPRLARASLALTGLSRNVPTIVFQFYLALMLPGEWLVPGTDWIIGVPAWVKAALALAVAVVGFTSDNLATALGDWRQGHRSAALLFVPAWGTYLVIIVIASSTASIIGVGELVSRSNAVINATGQTGLMVPVYLYAMAIFFAFCWPLVAGLRRARKALAARYARAGG
ncbi:polar amino acid ABC transporter permease [Ramlibacter sp. MAHUQ-53]|uniref:polar amino acid ABC transporter permease n=1 Tax=unclassified Ramlibacter TaxID=2617605 RepID=UPI0036407F4E